MKPRKFFGANSREVLKQVREVLGPDALIVSNAKVAGGIEVIALPSSSLRELVADAAVDPGGETADAGAALRDTKAVHPLEAPTRETQPRASTPRTAAVAPGASLDPVRRRDAAAPMAESTRPAASPPAPDLGKASAADSVVQGMLAELRSMR
ncbi:MAG: hypothetical protein EHM59_19960, partial [Betaproteobacteria bacterium]